jgi:hypothetical protein
MRNHYRSYRVPHFSPLLGEVGPLIFYPDRNENDYCC